MSSFKEQFEIPAKYKTWSMALMGIGVVSVVVGFFMYGRRDEEHQARFWGTMLQNSTYFLLTCNAAMFFICATTLGMGAFQMAFRRVTEAISVAVIPLGVIALIVLLSLVFGHHHNVYTWLTPKGDKILEGKSVFLNAGFFVIWTILTIGLWIALGYKMRSLSRELDDNPLPDVESGKKYIFKNTVWAALFLVWFALTVASTIPWLWLMSIDAHWYSTMYSWYTFASTFVSGCALIALWVIYLKNKGYLEYTNEEHLHDLGKFMFAFSIFWTYLWFAQYMLIWYANIPEETIYFKPRVQGVYKGIFFFNLIINFVAPILILMKKSTKRNYTMMTFMAVLIIFGHWIDFYQMVMASISKNTLTLGWLDFGVASLFIG